VLSIGGVAATTAGAVAIFKGHDGSADLALVGVGGVLLLLGIIGEAPTNLRVGNTEIAFAKRVVEELATNEPDIAVPAVAAIARTAREAGKVEIALLAETALNALAATASGGYSGAVADAIARLKPDDVSLMETPPDPSMLQEPRPDVVAFNAAVTLLVNAWDASRNRHDWLDRAVRAAGKLAEEHGPAPAKVRRLWVLQAPPLPLAEELMRLSDMHWVIWQSPDDDGSLRNQLSSEFNAR
jgi:stringent starvation protein B